MTRFSLIFEPLNRKGRATIHKLVSKCNNLFSNSYHPFLFTIF
ncbi:hypothetical protein J1P26_22275 [Neobacillus sp. MM2021_6]|nr:hypothetical protein [Neobacillus sp. MM2021_6]NHC21422.1 hypothetical protein [Bacillus sp. MM2020_4]